MLEEFFVPVEAVQ